jgi:hypothetical protein
MDSRKTALFSVQLTQSRLVNHLFSHIYFFGMYLTTRLTLTLLSQRGEKMLFNSTFKGGNLLRLFA